MDFARMVDAALERMTDAAFIMVAAGIEPNSPESVRFIAENIAAIRPTLRDETDAATNDAIAILGFAAGTITVPHLLREYLMLERAAHYLARTHVARGDDRRKN